MISAVPILLRTNSTKTTTNLVAPIDPPAAIADSNDDNSWRTRSPQNQYRFNSYNRDYPLTRQAALSQNITFPVKTIQTSNTADSNSIIDTDSGISPID